MLHTRNSVEIGTRQSTMSLGKRITISEDQHSVDQSRSMPCGSGPGTGDSNCDDIDVLVLSEPYRYRAEVEGWFSDIGARAVIVVFNPGLEIQTISPMYNTSFRSVKIEDITLYACYWSSNTAYTLFVHFLDRLEDSIKQQEGTVIAATDFNALSRQLGETRGTRTIG